VVEGSDCGTKWIEIDRRENDCGLTGQGGVKTFSISNPSQFRIIRIRQIGVNSYGSHCLVLKWIEFFGQLISPIQ
jgi:hypothetical protein